MSSPAVESARALFSAGQPGPARDALRRLLASRPRDLEAASLLAEVLDYLQDYEGAVVFASRVAAALPHDAHARIVRARVLSGLGQDRESDAEFAAAEAIAPKAAPVLRARPDALIRAGRTDEALGFLRSALEINPGNFGLLQSLCFSLNMVGEATPGEERKLHERLASALIAADPPPPARPFPNLPDPDRPLRIAFLSSDFRRHSCAYFLEPLIESLDRGKVSVCLYSAAADLDELTERFRPLGTWRDCARMTPADLESLARADGIDILIECGGWTAYPLLRAVARRLAPVQIAYLGYANTTGLSTVDWRVVDDTTDPPHAGGWCTERLLRIPGCFLCFKPDPESPQPRETRFQRGEGCVVFGSFNNGLKISPHVVQLWSEHLRRVPESRLMLKGPGLDGRRADRLVQRFARHGIRPSRLDIRRFAPGAAAHLAAYGEVDIALDTFPYNGTTTTCEALHMGVPVVTLGGDRHRSRVGASILNALGLSEFVAGDEARMIGVAATLAADPGRLREYRGALRGRLAGSGLCDGPGFARKFEAAVRFAWRDWCCRGPAPAPG